MSYRCESLFLFGLTLGANMGKGIFCHIKSSSRNVKVGLISAAGWVFRGAIVSCLEDKRRLDTAVSWDVARACHFVALSAPFSEPSIIVGVLEENLGYRCSSIELGVVGVVCGSFEHCVTVAMGGNAGIAAREVSASARTSTAIPIPVGGSYKKMGE